MSATRAEASRKLNDVDAVIEAAIRGAAASESAERRDLANLQRERARLDRALRENAADRLEHAAADLEAVRLGGAGGPHKPFKDIASRNRPAPAAVAAEPPTPALMTEATPPPTATARTEAAGSEGALLMGRSPGKRPVFGHLVDQVQRALRETGHDPAGSDMSFGPSTEAALDRWRAGLGRPGRGAMSFGDWAALTAAPAPRSFGLCAQATAAFEGRGFGSLVGDFDGAVATWGYHGYALRFGHLQAVLSDAARRSPGVIEAVFGAEMAREIMAMLALSLDDQIAWARSTILTSGGDAAPAWRDAFERAAAAPAIRAAFWEPIVAPQLKRLKLREPLSAALLFDAAIQQGGTRGATLTQAEETIGAPERDRRAVLADALAAQVRGDRFREDVRRRRRTFVDGVGRVHGANYDLADWGFAAPPGADPP